MVNAVAPVAPVLPVVRRLGWVDGVRGAAVGLMLLDHLLVQVDPGSTLRAGAPWSITRLSLPLFMLAAAAVWRPAMPWHRSRVRLLFAGIYEWVLLDALGMQLPGIVLVIWLVFTWLDVVAELLSPARLPWYWLGVLGLLQALYVPVPGGWAGYEPGLVLLWFCFAREYLVPGVALYAVDRAPLRILGRFPLTVYVGHLALLLLIFGGE